MSTTDTLALIALAAAVLGPVVGFLVSTKVAGSRLERAEQDIQDLREEIKENREAHAGADAKARELLTDISERLANVEGMLRGMGDSDRHRGRQGG